MAAHYQKQFEAWAEEKAWEVERLEFESELVFIINVKRET
jgi:hypothetical protein